MLYKVNVPINSSLTELVFISANSECHALKKIQEQIKSMSPQEQVRYMDIMKSDIQKVCDDIDFVITTHEE